MPATASLEGISRLANEEGRAATQALLLTPILG
jgi:hypothetical protein